MEGKKMMFIKRKAKNEELKTTEFKVRQLFASRSTFSVFMTLITLLIFIVGCPPVKTPPLEPPKTEPNDVTPPRVEPNDVKPPKVEPNDVTPPKTEPNDVKPPLKVSFHDKCADILKEFVNDEGMVNYKKLKHQKFRLEKLLDEFAKLDKDKYNSWRKEDKIAFWINAYNLKMLKIIVDNYPIESQPLLRILPTWGPYSIRHIEKNIGGINKQKFYAMDEEFTLGEIEQRFFRKQFDEPLVFFGLCRATLSHPPLRNEPYYGHKLYEQLNDQAKKFLSSTRAFRVDRKKKRVYISAILDATWYAKEFIPKYRTDKKFKSEPADVRAVLNFVTNYISKQDIFFLERENYTVKYIGYDWTINDSSKK